MPLERRETSAKVTISGDLETVLDYAGQVAGSDPQGRSSLLCVPLLHCAWSPIPSQRGSSTYLRRRHRTIIRVAFNPDRPLFRAPHGAGTVIDELR